MNNSRWSRAILVLIIGYFSISSSIYHTHHSHDDDISSSELTSHTHDVDISNESDHHHHHANSTHTEDHQHQYNTPFDWHILRILTKKSVQTSPDYFYVSAFILQKDDHKISYTSYKEPPIHNIYVNKTLIIRGPPLLV